MRSTGLALAVAVALACRAAAAAAEPPPVVLGDGQIAADVVVEASLTPTEVLHPLALAPDLWWGATSRLTVGVIESDASVDRVTSSASITHDTGVDARYLVWSDDAFAVAPRVRLLARAYEPFKPAATLGALASWHRGRWTLTTDPYLQLGLANTELGNRAALVVPVYAALRIACRWTLDVETGYASDLAVWHDGYHVPIGLEVTAHATAHVAVGAQVGLTSVLGPQLDLKEREAWLLLVFLL